jgi:hypothetical protein
MGTTAVATPWSQTVQDGDLGTWDKPRIILILEDVCARPLWRKEGIRRKEVLADPDEWEWAITTIKAIMRWSWNSVPVEVVTFAGREVADEAANWFNRYDVEVASVEAFDFKRFCRSLTWRRNNIQEIIDTDPERLLRYGQLGRQILWDGEF